MRTVSQAYINAILADATYALGEPDQRDLTGATGSRLEGYLSTRMTPTIAKYIGKNYMVVTHIESSDLSGSGFDATVWKDKATGKLYLSMQGSRGLSDFLEDVSLVASGSARNQLVDMVNWWLRATTPTDQLAKQVRTSYSDLNDPPWDFELAEPVMGTGKISAADLAGGIEVNGHSLGGYLATAFARLLGAHANVQHISTFNSAGFASGSEEVFQRLKELIGAEYGWGSMPSNSQQTNYFADFGLNFTTNSFFYEQVGSRRELFNEEGTGFPNHYMYKLTDTLALSHTLAKLDPFLETYGISSLLGRAANRTEASLEGLLDGVRKILGKAPFASMPIGDAGDSEPSRVDFHSNLNNLMALDADGNPTGIFAALQDKVSILDYRPEPFGPRIDFNLFVSLYYLTPQRIMFKDVDDVQTANAYRAAHQSLFDQWSGNYGLEKFSISYINDRTMLLGEVRTRNIYDDTSAVKPADYRNTNTYYQDVASGFESRVGYVSDDDREHFRFGGEGGDSLISGRLNDHIYGGGGNDWIETRAGNDYLEGNGGADHLLGGIGDDTYRANVGDIINDTDGVGRVYFKDQTISGGTLRAGQTAYIDDSGNRYVLNGRTLVVNNSLTIEEFDQDDLGIHLNVDLNSYSSNQFMMGSTGSDMRSESLDFSNPQVNDPSIVTMIGVDQTSNYPDLISV